MNLQGNVKAPSPKKEIKFITFLHIYIALSVLLKCLQDIKKFHFQREIILLVKLMLMPTKDGCLF